MFDIKDMPDDYVQGVTDSEILVANTATLTGEFGFTGSSIVVGIQGYFDMVNSQGGIDGRKLRLVHLDDMHDTNEARRDFQMLVEKNRVFAYVGHFGSSIVRETLDDIRQTGIPAVYFATGIEELYVDHAEEYADGANCYPVQPLYVTEGEKMVIEAGELFNADKIGIVYTSDNTGVDILLGAARKSAELGIEAVKIFLGNDLSERESAIELLKRKNVDMVIIASAQNDFTDIVKLLLKKDVRKPVITSYLNISTAAAREVASEIDGKFDLYANGWLLYTTEESAENLQEASKWLGDYAINQYAHCGWIAAHFLCEGLKRLEGKKLTWNSFRQAMESEPIKNPFGGYVDYSKGMRKGFSDFYLHKMDCSSVFGWKLI
jgi:branched-chain amino acid transport system substrate-binding protein